MGLPVKQVALVVLMAGVIFAGGVLYPIWRAAVDANRDARADPYHIAGPLYFVGAPDVASFLLIGPQGHVLIDGGYEGTAHKIIDNVAQLGFDIRDVRILLASDPHSDEAGGLAALQQASGAELWTSDANADVIASGGKDDPSIVYLPHKMWALAGVIDYAAPRIDHRVNDGETIRLGPLAVTAHLTPGHSPGCTTWTFIVRDRDRDLHVVHRCSLVPPIDASFTGTGRYPGIRADFERTFGTLRKLTVDIWVTAHGIEYGRYRKYQESLRVEDPAAPFIDREGYVKAIDDAEARFRKMLADQQQ